MRETKKTLQEELDHHVQHNEFLTRVVRLYEKKCTQLNKLVADQADLIVQLKDKHEGFYQCQAWLELRLRVLDTYGPKCMCCFAHPNDGVAIQVDHIKPISLYPHLALVFDNLQVLCEKCNYGKSNKTMTDYRPKRPTHDLPPLQQ